MIKAFVAASAVALLVTGCGKDPGRPVADGYTLHGVVLEAGTGAPLSDVAVLMGSETNPELYEFREIAVTDANGAFTLKPFPNTAPSTEVLRLTKPGYAPLDVLARTAVRLEEFRYRLEVRLEPGP